MCMCVGVWCVCVREKEIGSFLMWKMCVCVCDREFSNVVLNLLLSVKSLGESQRCLHKEE